MKWLFFSYSLPTEPSKSRVYVWRQVKRLGAINYQSAWVLPYSSEHVAELKRIVGEIARYAGESLLIEGKALDKGQESLILRAFQEARDEEYRELIEKCEDFFREIAFEIERRNFVFGEVEENEEELEKLKQWLRKIEKRDRTASSLRKTAIAKIRECEKRFEDFARTVFLFCQAKGKGEATGSGTAKGKQRKTPGAR